MFRKVFKKFSAIFYEKKFTSKLLQLDLNIYIFCKHTDMPTLYTIGRMKTLYKQEIQIWKICPRGSRKREIASTINWRKCIYRILMLKDGRKEGGGIIFIIKRLYSLLTQKQNVHTIRKKMSCLSFNLILIFSVPQQIFSIILWSRFFKIINY